MNRTETSAGSDFATLLDRQEAALSSVSGEGQDPLQPDGRLETDALSSTVAGSPCDSPNAGEEVDAETQTLPAKERSDPTGLTAAEVGAHFAAEIANGADEALRVAARLGPKRVLSLLV